MWDLVTFGCASEPLTATAKRLIWRQADLEDLTSRPPRLLVSNGPIAVMAFLHHLSHPHDFRLQQKEVLRRMTNCSCSGSFRQTLRSKEAR